MGRWLLGRCWTAPASDPGPLYRPVAESALALPRRPIGPPRFPRRVCKLCDELDWQGEEWLSWLDAMGESFRRAQKHRKVWEWTQGLYALDQLGLLHEDATAVGVGQSALTNERPPNQSFVLPANDSLITTSAKPP